MDDIIRPKIDLKQQETVKCEKCNSKFFKEVVLLKKVPKKFNNICRSFTSAPTEPRAKVMGGKRSPLGLWFEPVPIP